MFWLSPWKGLRMTLRCSLLRRLNLATALQANNWLRPIIVSNPLNMPILIVEKQPLSFPQIHLLPWLFALTVACDSHLGSFCFSNAEGPCHDKIKYSFFYTNCSVRMVSWDDSSLVIGLWGPTLYYLKWTNRFRLMY